MLSSPNPMTFGSIEFLVLLATVTVLYFNLPQPLRNPLLLVASCVFYMWWKPAYILLILFSAGVDYIVARALGGTSRPGARRALLLVSLVSNLGLLFFFKYFAFACDALKGFLGLFDVGLTPPAIEVLLPVGISFYTFQALSYTIDVYLGRIPPERRFDRLFLYVMFFPQLVAGPIERSQHLLPQFSEPKTFDYERATSGLRMVLWGLIKKMVIADSLARLVEPVYNNPTQFSGLPLVIATYAFAVQIYCDFSAYSEIAIGTARILGFSLMDNFRRPYFSKSIPEFWKRWHISLSTWFRDYVYIPLGGNRKGRPRWYFNLLATFVLSGIWHGAKWTFVAWGAYHGILMLLSVATEGLRSRVRLPAWVRAAVTFHLVLAGWVLFRANSLSDAGYIFSHLFQGASLEPLLDAGLLKADLVLAAVAAVALLGIDLAERRRPAGERVRTWPAAARWTAYVAAALVLLNLSAEVEIPFIYFQF